MKSSEIFSQIMKDPKYKKEFEKARKTLTKHYSKNFVPSYEIDRAVIIIKKKKPFLDWIKNLPDSDLEITIDDLNSEPSTYLIPAYEENYLLLAHLSAICHEIFVLEMNGWWTEEEVWEKDLSWENFNLWFEYDICSLPIDLGEGEIFREEY